MYNLIKDNLFVNIMILLQIGAVISYGKQGKWNLVLYWVGCLIINLVVTYGNKK